MTKKDFETVAKIVALLGNENRGLLFRQAVAVCDILEQENPSFDREKFVGFVLGERARQEAKKQGGK